MIELSSHLRRIVVTGDSLADFPEDQQGSYVKVFLPQDESGEHKKRSYTIRQFDKQSHSLHLDFVINRHQGPATDWAKQAKVGDPVGIAGPGPLKLTNFQHHSYLLVADLTSMNAINGYVPRFPSGTTVKAIISVPTRSDVIDLDYDSSSNTHWHIEDETEQTLVELVTETATSMPQDSHVFMGLEAGAIRALRPVLQEQLGFSRLNIFAVGYWKQGVDADRFGQQKKAQPL
ncbi:siderophore-interacting protein [Vibrio hippocampi]|uniref:siderophore-interacting protein n=1 Tax=Vibrio hippocampi TaxID=654686 RepID=UPI001F2E15FD|nr:siderophore-interacting protein [Vibrio hippocampi]